MTNTMVTDFETEAAIREETGHTWDCMEWWMETALEAGVDGAEIYALWYQETANGFANTKYGKCHCDEE